MDKQELFNYLKENVSIKVNVEQCWGYYENGEPMVEVSLLAFNPETGKNEVISVDAASA